MTCVFDFGISSAKYRGFAAEMFHSLKFRNLQTIS